MGMQIPFFERRRNEQLEWSEAEHGKGDFTD